MIAGLRRLLDAHTRAGGDERQGFLDSAGDVARKMTFGDSANTKNLNDTCNLNEQLN